MSGRKVRLRTDAKGRTNKEAKHLRLYWWTFNSAAYRSLGCVARCLLSELVFAHDGTNNGEIVASYRWALDRLGVGSFATVQKAFGELLDRGFIRIAKPGGFDWKSGARSGEATRWTVTLLEGPNGEQPSKDFMSWQPGTGSEKKSTATERVAHRYRACSRRADSTAKKAESATERVAVKGQIHRSTATERVTSLVNYREGGSHAWSNQAEYRRAADPAARPCFDQQVADSIRAARQSLRWTQGKLASTARTHQPIISQIERANFAKVGTATIRRVAQAVGVEIGVGQ